MKKVKKDKKLNQTGKIGYQGLGVDQHLGVNQLFKAVFLNVSCENKKNTRIPVKMSENGKKKYFDQLSGA